MLRVYVSQGVIDRWLSEGRAQLDHTSLILDDGAWSLVLDPALLFESLDGPGDDANDLVGTVKSELEVAEIGGEHAETTAVVGESTYVVRPGFVVIASGQDGETAYPGAPNWAALCSSLSA